MAMQGNPSVLCRSKPSTSQHARRMHGAPVASQTAAANCLALLASELAGLLFMSLSNLGAINMQSVLVVAAQERTVRPPAGPCAAAAARTGAGALLGPGVAAAARAGAGGGSCMRVACACRVTERLACMGSTTYAAVQPSGQVLYRERAASMYSSMVYVTVTALVSPAM